MNPEPLAAINRLLPHAYDAEKGLLCAFMLDPATVGAMCAEKRVSQHHFYHVPHIVVFSLLMASWEQSKPMDLITLTNSLRDGGMLAQAGGVASLNDISTFLPTAWMAGEYVEICESKRILRALIRQAEAIVEIAHAETGDAATLANDFAANVGTIACHALETAKPKTPKEMVIDASVRAQERVEKRGLPDNVMQTGLKQLDEAMSGIRAGDFVLISGKEKSGKTSLAFNIFEHVVFEQGKRAIAISLEMKIPEITDRMISSIGRINFTNILNGWMSDIESQKFVTASQKIAAGTFQVRDDIFTLAQIVAVLRQYKAAHPDTELAIVDYLQLVDGDKVGKDDSREQIIAKTSRTLRRAASELNLGMLMLVQLNEDGQVRESRSPGMDCTAHIRIEPGEEEGQKWARVVYQRNGPSNVGIPVTHIGQYLRFEQGAPRDPSPDKPKKRNWT